MAVASCLVPYGLHDCEWILWETVVLELPTHFSIGLLGGQSSGTHTHVVLTFTAVARGVRGH